MDEPALKTALNGHGFGLRDKLPAFASTSGPDERAPAAVLNDELGAKYLGDLALHRDLAPILHGGDRRRRLHEQSWATGLQGAVTVKSL